MKNFIKEITILPAFDKRSEDPAKNYGIHGCDMRFVLKGSKGAVQFVVYTNWQLPHVEEEFLNSYKDKMDVKCRFIPSPADVGYHSPKPMYNGQTCVQKSCKHLDGKPCYYDGSGLEAENAYKILVEKGSEGVWEYLEEYYNDTFENKQ